MPCPALSLLIDGQGTQCNNYLVQMADADDAAEHNYDSVDGVAKLSSSERYTSVMQVCSCILSSRARPASIQYKSLSAVPLGDQFAWSLKEDSLLQGKKSTLKVDVGSPGRWSLRGESLLE